MSPSEKTNIAGTSPKRRFERDGVVCLRGAISHEWVERLRGAVERSFVDPGRIDLDDGGGRFHLNAMLFLRDPDVRAFVLESPAARIAQELMQSRTVRFYFDQIFVKEPGTAEKTPWHHDLPYWPVEGSQVVSLWLALDPVTAESSGLEYVRGSHRWPNRFRPEAWGPQTAENLAAWQKMGLLGSEDEAPPDIEAHRDELELLRFDCEPGDVIAHHALTVHGSPGNASPTQRRRALSTRWVGDDARYAPRPGSFVPLLDDTQSPGEPLTAKKHPLVIAS